jgi:hypothetical protein
MQTRLPPHHAKSAWRGPRLARFVLLALLLASGIAAANLVWSSELRIQVLEDRRLALDRVVDRITPAIAAIAGAQNAYVDYGVRDEATFVRVGELVDQMTTDAALLRSSDPSGTGAAHLEEFWAALSALTANHAQAREMLAAGEALAAADLLFASPRRQVMTLATELRAFRAAELNGLRTERAALTERSWFTLAAVALFWVGGLVALVRVPLTPPPHAAAQALPPTDPVVESPSAVDLAATADLCVAILRLTDTASLPVILERAAGILDAHGIIIWMAAGDELFAATAFGYGEAVMARLPPIHRTAQNATAMTWRTGKLRTVGADDSSLGAIVAPMFGPSGCIGVLAAEVPKGRDTDAATCAVTAILASQLAGILAAWPAAVTSEAAEPAGPPRETAGSDRQPAAS